MRSRHNKYGAIPTATIRIGCKRCVLAAAGTDGYRFASQKEKRRYQELRLLDKAGEIKDLEVHPQFPLVVNGQQIGNYTGDFSYVEISSGKWVVEDVKAYNKKTGLKPTMTEAYRLRKKLMWA